MPLILRMFCILRISAVTTVLLSTATCTDFGLQGTKTRPGSGQGSAGATKHYAAGIEYANHENWDEAIAEYRQALRLNPRYLDAHRALAHALEQEGNPEAALAEYRIAIKLKPDDFNTHLSVYFILEALRDWDREVAEGREVVSIWPTSAMAHNFLAGALLDKGEFEGAIREYREALRLEPSSGTHSFLSIALLKNGQFTEALQELQLAIAQNPVNRKLRVQYGELQARVLGISHENCPNVIKLTNQAKTDAFIKLLQDPGRVWQGLDFEKLKRMAYLAPGGTAIIYIESGTYGIAVRFGKRNTEYAYSHSASITLSEAGTQHSEATITLSDVTKDDPKARLEFEKYW